MQLTFAEALWCVYNSSALQSALGLAVLGVIGIILPAMVELPPKATPSGDELHTPRDEFNRLRRSTFYWGCSSILLSLITSIIFVLLTARFAGKTCEHTADSCATILIYALWMLSLGVIFVFGRFYFVWQRALRVNEEARAK